MKRYWLGVYGQVRALQKRFLRDKTALFFTFLFPLIFLLVFGAIFNNKETSLNVAIINQSNTEFSKYFVKKSTENDDSPLKVKKDITTVEDAYEKLKHSEIEGVIILPKDFGEIKDGRPGGEIKVRYSKGSNQAGQTLSAIIGQIANGINQHMGLPESPIKVASSPVGDAQLKSFDYTFTGLLAFSLMSMGIFGLANAMPGEKQGGAYRRLRAAPFSAGQLIIANSIHYVIISLISVITMLVVGILVFGFVMRGSWLVFAIFTILSAIMTVGFGLLVGGWAKNENQVAPISNLVGFPMMFLSGAFFPTFLFPEWLKGVSTFIPLSPVVDGLRLIMTENASLMAISTQILFVVFWIVLVYVAAIRVFRWE